MAFFDNGRLFSLLLAMAFYLSTNVSLHELTQIHLQTIDSWANLRQLSPPGHKNLRAGFLNGTSLKNLARSAITNPTKTSEELVQRARKMGRKGAKRSRRDNRFSDFSNLGLLATVDLNW